MKEMMSKSAATDLELVKAIKAGGINSERAFSELFKKYQNSMMFHFKGYINDDEKVKELVLDAFVKVSTNLEKYDEKEAVFSTWLFKLTKNLFIDSLRKKKEDVVSLSDLATIDDENHTIEYEITSPDGTPESKMLNTERDKIVRDIVSKMKNKKLAKVIELRFFEGLPYEKICKITNSPLGTVKGLIFRAKEILEAEFVKANLGTLKKIKEAKA